ncbi:hypothetical protein ACTA71_002909 [Dictyostelium dimigraforme]
MKDRENVLGIDCFILKKGELLQVKVNNKDVILGKIIKHRGKYFALEVGRKKLKVQVRVPKRKELTLDVMMARSKKRRGHQRNILKVALKVDNESLSKTITAH